MMDFTGGGAARRGILLSAVLCGSLLIPSGRTGAFDLPKSAVYPRIFSPNGDGVNDVVLFDLANPSLDTVEGRIYDALGNPVADLQFDSYPGGNVERWRWDGRDRNGNVVPGGVYIYEIQGGGKSVTGTVAVAK